MSARDVYREWRDVAEAGTLPEWVLLLVLLPFVGRAVAAAWGPRGVLAAQRALLVVVADLALALLLAFPVNPVPWLVASLPLVGASVRQRARPRLHGDPLAWLGAFAFALPAVTINHLGPFAWSPWWFIGLLGLALARGLVEPLVAPARKAWSWTRVRVRPRDADAPAPGQEARP